MKQRYHIIIEIFFLIIVAVQFLYIRSLSTITDEKVQKGMSTMLSSMAQDRILGKCGKDLEGLYDSEEKKDFEAIIEQGNRLIKNGYERDKFVLREMARAYYKKGDKAKAIELYTLSFRGKLTCEITRPIDDTGIYFDDAIIHYALSMIYREIGNNEMASKEEEISIALSKLFYDLRGKTVRPEVIIKHAESILRN